MPKLYLTESATPRPHRRRPEKLEEDNRIRRERQLSRRQLQKKHPAERNNQDDNESSGVRRKLPRRDPKLPKRFLTSDSDPAAVPSQSAAIINPSNHSGTTNIHASSRSAGTPQPQRETMHGMVTATRTLSGSFLASPHPPSNQLLSHNEESESAGNTSNWIETPRPGHRRNSLADPLSCTLDSVTSYSADVSVSENESERRKRGYSGIADNVEQSIAILAGSKLTYFVMLNDPFPEQLSVYRTNFWRQVETSKRVSRTMSKTAVNAV